MSDKWISVADAISKLAEAQSIKPERAILPLWELARNGIVASRIALISDGNGNQSRKKVPMRKEDWEELLRLRSNDWFTNGRAAFSDDTVWHGIQINAADLEVYLESEKPNSVPWIEDFVSKPTFISLSEALSWMAFGKFMSKDQLAHALSAQAGSPSEGAVTEAMEMLCEQASEENISLLGRHLEQPSVDEMDIIHTPIDPDRLHEFRRFELHYDGMARGSGIVREADVPDAASERCSGGLRDVKVCRAELIECFPEELRNGSGPLSYRNGPTWVYSECDPSFVPTSAELDQVPTSQRAPAVKAGRPPSDEAILAKADEMKARGMTGRELASQMRHEPNFENVATTEVRELIKGRWKSTGRPKQKGA